MIAEALQYAATYPATEAGFRPFIRSSVSLWSRASRCSREWAEHEANCRAFVMDTISWMKQRRTAVVLGSGLLRDVPVEEMAKAFDTVVLVDLVHLASVRFRLKAKRLRNVRLISRDLSGFDAALAGHEVEPLAFLRQVPYLDLVVSANLLSQVGVGAERRLKQDGPTGKADILPQLIRAHLNGLAALPCSTVLLTDTGFRVMDREGRTLEEADLLHGETVPLADEAWDWPVVPLGEQSRDYQILHRVVAVRTLKA
nr:hypothetical protein REQ54_02488 [Rhizobium sp. Q54]